MGWSEGSVIMREIIEAVKPVVSDEEARKAIYARIIPVLDERDWDTQDECIGTDPAFDKALVEHDPFWRDHVDG